MNVYYKILYSNIDISLFIMLVPAYIIFIVRDIFKVSLNLLPNSHQKSG